MTTTPRLLVGIVGAGFAGLSSARVLSELGHDVVVWEKAPDVGGVWSATRRYPGLKTQNNKGTYALSEMPMPKHYPEWPSGEQVQAYLEDYARKFGILSAVECGTEVVSATPAATGGWDVTTASERGSDTRHVDHLVLASGIFSEPFVPPFEGREDFLAAGGEIMPAGDLHHLDQVAGKHAMVVGYGKSACDITVEVAGVAASTTVVARELLWKLPRKIKGVLNYKYLMLTRLGEGIFRYHTVSGVERLLHARNSLIAGGMVDSVGSVTTKQLQLEKLGLIPLGTFADIARATVSLVSEGFFEGVADGRIDVRRDTTVTRLLEKDGHPHAELSDGSVIRTDVILAATGWRQTIPFLPDEVLNRFTDERGDYVLYRQIHPVGVDDLSFAGYNSSFFSPLSAEVSALWIGSLLGGNHTLPSDDDMRQQVATRLRWMRERTRGNHARGTNVIPFSVHNIDETLSDIGLGVSRLTKAKEWLLPVNPSDYRDIVQKLKKRVRR
ncbi:flavin-containing monooxygenase [Rhodococcoides kroppenstedtii]|uniref:flavin-containing monooxygenase n=1 Tax=Rhodococcoides kroppenstedtii TaxID=293050 RepID=UPI001BDE58F5|nr:NAD(P)/FAD-dependent oxidoreductase [Rhodococcus kroppenstedtii]